MSKIKHYRAMPQVDSLRRSPSRYVVPVALFGHLSRIMDYLVRIQVEDAAKPKVDGGWVRGFDYTLWEYYGSNADESWTAYCMETGWTNAIINMTLSLYLLDDVFCPLKVI